MGRKGVKHMLKAFMDNTGWKDYNFDDGASGVRKNYYTEIIIANLNAALFLVLWLYRWELEGCLIPT
jgi:hypothetical protein